MRGLARVTLALMFVSACGDDTPGQNGNPAPPPPPPPPPTVKLSLNTHIEDLVSDHEKGGIRHQFKERDFAVEQNRDPFQSFIIAPQKIGPEQKKAEPGPKLCKDDKIQAAGYSIPELKLVGIVAQGISHKALVMGGNTGYIIKPGDCVGREKALVKEINDDFMTLVGQPDPNDPNKPQEKFEKTLHPKQIAMGSPEVGFDANYNPGVAHPVVQPPTPIVPPPGSTVTTTTVTTTPPTTKVITIPGRPAQTQQSTTQGPPATITP